MSSKLPKALAIPDRLNIFLLFLTCAGLVGLMVLGSRSHGLALGACLLGFSLVFLTHFSLLHEAAHDKFHSDARWNYVLGAFGCIIFPMPFSMFRVTHWNHHLRNRTDIEMFDMWNPGESPVGRRFAWYAALFGAWYWIIPPACVLLAFGPPSLQAKITKHHRKVGDLRQEDFRMMNVRRIKIEMALSILYFTSLSFAIGWQTVLLFHMVGTIWWSATQYIEHFRAPRHVLFGAWNLRASGWYSWLNLHRELDFNHHRYTEVPWIHLPRIPAAGHVGPVYLSHWIRQWSGPFEAFEPAPQPMTEVVADYGSLIL